MKINRRELFQKLYSKGNNPTIVDYSDRVEESMLEIIGKSRAALSFDSQRELLTHSKSFASRARKIWSKCRHFNSTKKHKGAVDDPYFDGDFTISNGDDLSQPSSPFLKSQSTQIKKPRNFTLDPCLPKIPSKANMDVHMNMVIKYFENLGLFSEVSILKEVHDYENPINITDRLKSLIEQNITY